MTHFFFLTALKNMGTGVPSEGSLHVIHQENNKVRRGVCVVMVVIFFLVRQILISALPFRCPTLKTLCSIKATNWSQLALELAMKIRLFWVPPSILACCFVSYESHQNFI